MKAFIYELTIFLIFADVSTAFAETWMLESDVLTVTVDSQGGGFLAREKRSGRKWGTVSDGAKFVPPVVTYRALRRTGTARLADLISARKISDGWRVGRDLATCHLEAGNADVALAITHEYLGRFPDCNPLEFLHARALCALGREEDAVSFLRGVKVLPSEFGNDAHGIWQTAWKGIACKARVEGNSVKAHEALAHSKEYPENLGCGKPYPDSVKTEGD